MDSPARSVIHCSTDYLNTLKSALTETEHFFQAYRRDTAFYSEDLSLFN